MDILKQINDNLQAIERNEIKNYKDLKYPIVFIVAPPRSGTTLTYQLLTLYYDFFYPTNLLAKFYKTPYVMSKIFYDLNLFENRNSSSFYSELGNTKGLLEPHEWGWFWERLFYKEDKNVIKQIMALQQLYKKPMIFKNVYFNHNIKKIQKYFSTAHFLYVKRNSTETIYSIYNAILKTNIPIGNKYILRGIKKFNDRLKLATLIYLFDIRSIEKDLNKSKYMVLRYENLLENFNEELNQFEKNFYFYTNFKLDNKPVEINSFKQKTFIGKGKEKEINNLFNLYKDLSYIDLLKILKGND